MTDEEVVAALLRIAPREIAFPESRQGATFADKAALVRWLQGLKLERDAMDRGLPQMALRQAAKCSAIENPAQTVARAEAYLKFLRRTRLA